MRPALSLFEMPLNVTVPQQESLGGMERGEKSLQINVGANDKCALFIGIFNSGSATAAGRHINKIYYINTCV